MAPMSFAVSPNANWHDALVVLPSELCLLSLLSQVISLLLKVFRSGDVQNGAGDIGNAARLLFILDSRGGLGFDGLWSGTGVTRNGTRPLSMLATYFVTEVPLVPCLQVLGRALAAVGAMLEPSLLKILLS
ncbi:hypothetical protein AMTR_s00120p00118980 [Amborella trichopoda]|uniref:Uncharacterized protein n=1 Tax=Amborella trichopoda TaxID=13333 RepID=W1NTW4_AMBTC|nr:hypothetical protein AMTR_s00120p00118980 [Amborella trichopoda]